jgi:hypothetical protein
MARRTSVPDELRTRISQKVERAAGFAAEVRRTDRINRRKEKTHREYWRLGCEKVGIKLTEDVASAIGYLWAMRSNSKRKAISANRPAQGQKPTHQMTSATKRPQEEKQLLLFPGPQHLWKV